MTLPFLLMTLHLSHIGFTDGLTFIFLFLRNFFAPSGHSIVCGLLPTRALSPRCRDGFAKNSAFFRLPAQPLLRQVILPLVRSYGLISSFTMSPGIMRM